MPISIPPSGTAANHPPVRQPAVRLLLGLALALFPACAGGGGGDGGSTKEDLNEGSYTVGDFGYVDEHPAGFHPLGSDGYQVLSREELFVVYPGYDGQEREFRMQEGPDEAHAEIGTVAALFPDMHAVYAAAGGQLDQDPESELVVVTLENANTEIGLYLVQRNLLGDYVRTPLQTIAAAGFSPVEARVALADLDGDFRDEIIVTARAAGFHEWGLQGRVWVLDDPQDGGAELLSFERNAGHQNLWALPVDADGDGDKELAIGLSGDTTDAGRYAVRLYDLEKGDIFMSQVHGWNYLNSSNDQISSRAVVGDFDSNGREDLAWIGYSRSSSTRMSIKLFELVAGEEWVEYAAWTLLDVSPAAQFEPGHWAATAFQPQIGVTDLAIAYPNGGAYDYSALHYDRDLDQWSFQGETINRYASLQGISLTGSDVDADGQEEVLVALLAYGGVDGTLNLGQITHDASGATLNWQDMMTIDGGPVGSSLAPVPVLAAADYDVDGFALRHTGMRTPKLGDPIPLVVMSAPPTVDGIVQNYDDTESAYSTGSSQGTSIGVSTYTSTTVAADIGFEIFGLLGAEGRASLETGVERTYESSRQETVVEGYRGAYDADVIVFQGTLYETYEYVIVAAQDPSVIGRYMTLDIPIDANTYKWTVDYYNDQVAADDRIGSDLLTHSPGDIQSYPTRAELNDMMGGELHWDLDASRPVGQGNASDFQSVSFETESATSEQRTVSKSYGGGGTFGVTVDVDFGSTEGSSHSVLYGSETSFEATVGDISSPEDYEAWRYNWGFSIHFTGRTADAENQPMGYSSRKHNFQYLRYWAQPTGTGY